MAGSNEKAYRTFVKGIVTEASALTFPENASVNEDNFVLNRDGSRTRRLGVDYEPFAVLTPSGFGEAVLKSGKQSSHKWQSPGGDTTVSICVVRIYNKLWFYDLLTDVPSASLLNGGNPIVLAGLTNSEIETSVLNNNFIIVSKDLPLPIALIYNPTTKLVTQTQVPIYVRDIWGVDDQLLANERPVALSNKHKYNLRNQGWSTRIVSTPAGDAIDVTKTSLGVYPSNSDIWTLGKNQSSNTTNFQSYEPGLLSKNSISNTTAAKGTHVIDAFYRGSQRATITGITGLPQDKEQGTFTTVASYASRIFYSGILSNILEPDKRSPNYTNYVFFTQVVTDNEKLGKCHQEADPTDENINDLIATDGGTIQIPEVTKIIKIATAGSSLVVFAENGIWEIYGDTGGFIATSFQVSKTSNNGVLNSNAIVEVNGGFIYWSKAGIYALKTDGVSGRMQAINLSLTSIQKLYLSIPDLAKDNARGFFDEKENRVRWLYNDTETYSASNYINRYNRELVLDLTLQSFYPVTISSLASNSPYVASYIEVPGYAVTSIDADVYVNNQPVVDTANEQVTVNIEALSNRSSQFSFLTIVGTSFTISKYSSEKFADWTTADQANGYVGAYYTSFILTGYELFGDLMRKKQTPYIFLYFNRTEDGFVDSNGNLIFSKPSGCIVQAQWNWADSANSGKWGTPFEGYSQFQAYKFIRNYTPADVNDPFDYGESVIVTKNKLRGSGRCLSLKITSEPGKDMHILGWGFPITADTKV